MKYLLELKAIYIFFIYAFFSILMSELIQNRLIHSDILYHMMDHLSFDQVSERIEAMKERHWWESILYIAFIFLKLSISTFFIHMVVTFMDIEINWGNIFKLNTIAQFVFLLIPIISLLKMYTISSNEITKATLSTQFLSAAATVQKEDLAIPVFFFLKSINVFELAYVTLFCWSFYKSTNLNLKEVLSASFISWIVLILLHVSIISFLVMTLSGDST